MINDGNCEELKGYISRCRFFVGARTHATIAAYSSFIPTLVIGYSVKSKGIAKDLFGEYNHFVTSVQNLENKDDLIKAFRWLYNHEDSIRRDLKAKMCSYRSSIMNVHEYI